MLGHKPRTNRFLILSAVLLCLACGGIFTQSSANPSPISEGAMPDMFVAGNMDEFSSGKDDIAMDENAVDDTVADNTDVKPSQDDTSQFTDSGKDAAVPKKAKKKVSPEASRGVWTASGSSWIFLVDGTAYTGWLYDTDGHIYFFGKDGIMKTGWLEDNGKKYYLDADGILQTGDIKIDKKTYHFSDDGSLINDSEDIRTSGDDTKKEDSAKKKSNTKKNSGKKKKTVKTKIVALTFDDGPSSYTDRLLDCLEANNAKATFFLVGQEISNFSETVKRADKLGCEIGNHTYSHTDLTTLDAQGISQAIGQTDQLLLELIGHGATVVRPPYGSVNDNVCALVGTPMILWSIDTLDWETKNADQTVQTVLDNVKDGDIILMHDIYEESVKAAEILIPKLIEKGYDLVTVHELAARHGKELNTGIPYGSFS